MTLDCVHFPRIWYYYLDYYSPTKIPTLFHYIVKYNQKELLVLFYNKNVWCASIIILEAIQINNKEFEDAAWIYLEDLFDRMNGNPFVLIFILLCITMAETLVESFVRSKKIKDVSIMTNCLKNYYSNLTIIFIK